MSLGTLQPVVLYHCRTGGHQISRNLTYSTSKCTLDCSIYFMKSYFISLPMIKFPSFPFHSYIFLVLGFKITISCSVFRKREPLFRCKISKTSIFLSHSLLHTQDLQAASLVTTGSFVSTHLGSWSGFGWEWEFDSTEKKITPFLPEKASQEFGVQENKRHDVHTLGWTYLGST